VRQVRHQRGFSAGSELGGWIGLPSVSTAQAAALSWLQEASLQGTTGCTYGNRAAVGPGGKHER
jgi:hypothetical protein